MPYRFAPKVTKRTGTKPSPKRLATGVTEGGKKLYGKAPKMGYKPKSRDPEGFYAAGKGKR